MYQYINGSGKMALRAAGLETKKRILSVCVRLFLEQGYKNTTVRQIVNEAGTSISAFQNIFHSKDGVLLDLVGSMFGGQFGYKTAQVGDAAKGHYAVYRCTSPECSQSTSGYWDDLAGDVIPHDYNKWGECTTCWYECTHSSADRIWHSENGQYWKECGACGREFAKNDIPVNTINAPDEVCRTQDCAFTFNLPEGCRSPEFGYEFVSVGSGDSAVTLWLALLLISGGAMAVTARSAKKSK